MPNVTKAFLFSAMAYLLATLGAGVLIAIDAEALRPLQQRLPLPVYLHLWAIGWLTQLIFGIAYWLLPTISREAGRGHPGPLWFAWVCINIGMPLRTICEPLAMQPDATTTAKLGVAMAAVLLWLAAVGFVVNIWRRIR